MLYLVSYDLNKDEKNYPALTSTLQGLGAVKVLFSEWLLPNDASAVDINSHVRTNAKMDPDDRLLVSEVTKNSAWYNLFADKPTLDRLFQHARP